MFRARSPQGSLFQSAFLFPEEHAKRQERSWADMFQARALPLIDEEPFAPMYCEDNGRPNRAVQIVLGVLVLKEMFNLTDEEALENLEFNLLWHHALRHDAVRVNAANGRAADFLRGCSATRGGLDKHGEQPRRYRAQGVYRWSSRVTRHPHPRYS